ncbi:MAG: PucR family transcriptional regulator ligand-binding domain-containing protein [Eubacteriales bacterium]|nr:PucR family transcriptional regulator ligand-binding domain-containing protein [Eubacteriales bacterium]
MGLTVQDLLEMEQVNQISLICGTKGLTNEITGVTIIEAPDIVHFITGGELLLTGLYAFQSCSIQEYKTYIEELRNKQVSGIILKQGRDVEDAAVKIAWLKQFSEEHAIPLMEMPFEMSFQSILTAVMERLFNEEVTQLKYYKTTHDNFLALCFSDKPVEQRITDILDMLQKLIGNPVALFQQNMSCYAYSGESPCAFQLSAQAKKYDPGILTNYAYLVQHGARTQYVVQLNLNVGAKMYLVITEETSEFNLMNCIAVENAIVALQYEFAKDFAVSELEKKFQNDILYSILHGKNMPMDELQKNTALIGMDIDGSYRVIVFGAAGDAWRKRNINERMADLDSLEDAVRRHLRECKIHRETDRIVAVKREMPDSAGAYRKELRDAMEAIQAAVLRQNQRLHIKAGIGKLVQGLVNLPETYHEANDAYLFVDIAGDAVGDTVGEHKAQMVWFSDLGIFKLLCQIEDPDDLMEYVPESLQKLFDYKRPQREDLIITLKTYLDHNQNLSKTAQDLFVHYKTASYRMEKIAKITGIDFDNANEILAVRIGLVVYQMIGNYHKNTGQK